MHCFKFKADCCQFSESCHPFFQNKNRRKSFRNKSRSEKKNKRKFGEF